MTAVHPDVSAPLRPGTTILVRPWVDPVVDEHPLSMPVLSLDAELYWLPAIGPTAYLCARRLVGMTGRALVAEPAEVELDRLAASLGVGTRGVEGHNAPIVRTIKRLCRFGFAVLDAQGLAVRCVWPPLTERQIDRLPESLVGPYRRRIAP